MSERSKGGLAFDRRMFLKGAFGVTVALPLLESVVPGGGPSVARAADPSAPVHFVCVRSGNGVVQKTSKEEEKFWPMDLGPLTRDAMRRTDAAGDMRSIAELADYADDLLIVSGCKYLYPGNGCGHSGGGNQCLTATPPSDYPEKNKSLATGESVDNLIQRKLQPGAPEPLTLMGGRTSGFLNEVLSYAPPLAGETNGRLRSAERNPWEVYKSIFGDPATQDQSDYLHNQIAEQRRSVNDLLREQFDHLKRRPYLSQADRQRLEQHQAAVRDLEKKMLACHLPDTDWGPIKQAGESGAWRDEVNAEQMIYMMMDIIALSFACDLKRSATLQIGNGNDGTRYQIDGPTYPFHWISHRIQGDGGSGSAPPIDNAADLHRQIDRLQLRYFKYLVDRLAERTTPTGRLLDQCVALWTNDLSSGPCHSYRNLPYIIAGSGGGYLKTGHFIDARDTGQKESDGWVYHGQFFNTVINACGVRKDNGDLVDDFGHKGGLNKSPGKGGEIPGMKRA